MAENSQQRPDIEPRRASASVADIGTQTEEEQAPEQHTASLVRTQSLDRNNQLAPRRSAAQNDQVIRRPDEAVVPQHHHDRGGAPEVRLDMDLDVDIKMQAKIKGEIELSIL